MAAVLQKLFQEHAPADLVFHHQKEGGRRVKIPLPGGVPPAVVEDFGDGRQVKNADGVAGVVPHLFVDLPLRCKPFPVLPQQRLLLRRAAGCGDHRAAAAGPGDAGAGVIRGRKTLFQHIVDVAAIPAGRIDNSTASQPYSSFKNGINFVPAGDNLVAGPEQIRCACIHG